LIYTGFDTVVAVLHKGYLCTL